MSDQLKTISYTDETAKNIIKKFCAHVHWLVRVRHIYKVLFEDVRPSCRTLMEKTAPSFFADLNRILQEYLLLECAKITDPATTGKYENFTVDCLVQKIRWPNGDILKKLESLKGSTDDFRSDIECARNKFLAHLDKEAVLSGEPLGAFPEGKDKTFLDALQNICNITHEACIGTIYGDMLPITGGDVINLRKTLACAVAFEEALSESSGQNETWLYSCLEKARHEPKS
ncbi:MAG: hypothetical protein ABSD98_13275 [Candidatus Korobacteraceae bacterium]|jgi:HEPN superfamily AbiU2-like protein